MNKGLELFRRHPFRVVVVLWLAAITGFILWNTAGLPGSSYDACEDARMRRGSAKTDTMFSHALVDVEKFCEPQEEFPTPFPTSTPEAIERFTEAIRLNPQNALSYQYRGFAYSKLGQYEQAIQDFDEVMRLDHQNARTYTGRGIAYSSLDQYEQAIQDYDEAIRLDPQDADAYYNRGVAYYYLDQHERAIQNYDEAIRLDPQYAYGYYARGVAYEALGKTIEAERDFAKAKELGVEAP